MELDNTLRGAGYEVLGPVPNVRRALGMLAAGRPDAAVLDVNLNGEWVTPVAEALRAMVVPFILTSGYGAADLHDVPVLRDAVNIGKPSKSELLLKALRGALADRASADPTLPAPP